MKFPLPLCAAPDAFKLLNRHVDAIESPEALLMGGVAISMHQTLNVRPDDIDARIQSYADEIRTRLTGNQPQAIFAHMHEFLFEDLGFRGDAEHYYEPGNSYIPTVLDSRKGLPITLTLIYKNLAERLGLRVWGVPLPGHFLAGTLINGKQALIDPFAAGRLLTPEEAQTRVHDLFGQEIEWSDEILRPASNRHWLTRIVQNLLNIFGAKNQYHHVAAMLEMEILLWPEQDRLQRDLALVLARVGMAAPAHAWLDQYLTNNPDDPQQKDLQQLLNVLTA